MTTTVAPESASVVVRPAPPRRRRWALWTSLAGALVIAAAGTISAVAIAFHYAHAQPLECACGLAWAQPDAGHSRDVSAGPSSAAIVRARPGHAQTFYVLIVNRSSVTQTILGQTNGNCCTAEPTHLAVAVDRGSPMANQAEPSSERFVTRAVRLAPQAIRWIRYTIDTAGGGYWTKNRSEYWTQLQLRVRVGAFTRAERVDFGHFAFELTGV